VTSGLFIGRTRAGFRDELLVIEASVSRWHARVQYEASEWWIRDLNSRNGTFVGDQRVVDRLPMRSGHTLRFGDVAFTFSQEHEPPNLDLSWSTADGRVSQLRWLELVPMGGTRGGVITFGGKQEQLSNLSFRILEFLVARGEKDALLPGDVRGYCPSRELLAELPWTTPYPNENHLKQAIRRLRQTLGGMGIARPIEARQGLGYRLRPDVKRRHTR